MPVSTWSSDGFFGDRSGCSLLVREKDSVDDIGFITLGLSFLHQFTVAFDPVNRNIQIATSIYAADGVEGGAEIVPSNPN